MRFEKSIDIDAPQQRVWDVLSALEDWPQRIETVDTVELLTPAPIATGSRVRLKQPKLPEGTWDITVWDAPSYFEWRQEATGIASVAPMRSLTAFRCSRLSRVVMLYAYSRPRPRNVSCSGSTSSHGSPEAAISSVE